MEYGTLAEKKALAKRSNLWIGAGVLFEIVSILALIVGLAGIFGLVRLIEAVVWTVGCVYYARSKGWSGTLGLLGLLTWLGVLVLVLFPDRWGRALDAIPGADGRPDLTNYPR